ncbi:MAG: hypothetical protein H7301_14485 [Cryobacterium sp.]|nr:hypothetical protein [Oligoflexia bacterium]
MKKMILILLALMSSTAFASSESIRSVSDSPLLTDLERQLVADGYELRSIEDNSAGLAYRSKCGCSVYTAKFQKSKIDGDSIQTSVRIFSLKMGLDGEKVSEITGRQD